MLNTIFCVSLAFAVDALFSSTVVWMIRRNQMYTARNCAIEFIPAENNTGWWAKYHELHIHQIPTAQKTIFNHICVSAKASVNRATATIQNKRASLITNGFSGFQLIMCILLYVVQATVHYDQSEASLKLENIPVLFILWNSLHGFHLHRPPHSHFVHYDFHFTHFAFNSTQQCSLNYLQRWIIWVWKLSEIASVVHGKKLWGIPRFRLSNQSNGFMNRYLTKQRICIF